MLSYFSSNDTAADHFWLLTLYVFRTLCREFPLLFVWGCPFYLLGQFPLSLLYRNWRLLDSVKASHLGKLILSIRIRGRHIPFLLLPSVLTFICDGLSPFINWLVIEAVHLSVVSVSPLFQLVERLRRQVNAVKVLTSFVGINSISISPYSALGRRWLLTADGRNTVSKRQTAVHLTKRSLNRWGCPLVPRLSQHCSWG